MIGQRLTARLGAYMDAHEDAVALIDQLVTALEAEQTVNRELRATVRLLRASRDRYSREAEDAGSALVAGVDAYRDALHLDRHPGRPPRNPGPSATPVRNALARSM